MCSSDLRAKIMVGIDPETAGTNKPTLGVNAGIIGLEQPLRWHQTKNVYDSIANPLTAASTRDILNIEKACVMDMMVTNSAWASGASNQANGMIFLDYIRFSPILDDEE